MERKAEDDREARIEADEIEEWAERLGVTPPRVPARSLHAAKAMTHNVGGTERQVRGAAGTALLAAAFSPRGALSRSALFGGVGAVLLATALLRYCPVNQLVGRLRG